MVLKLHAFHGRMVLAFESDVISDGTQTATLACKAEERFESDVISDGTQTSFKTCRAFAMFESDVISDGTQT